MSELNRYAARLEFDKVCAEVAHYAVCALAKEKIIGTEPVSDLMQAAEQMEGVGGALDLLGVLLHVRPLLLNDVAARHEKQAHAEQKKAQSEHPGRDDEIFEENTFHVSA